MSVKNGASTSPPVGTTEQLLWGVDPSWHRVPGLLTGACGSAGEVLDRYSVWLQLLLSSTIRHFSCSQV